MSVNEEVPDQWHRYFEDKGFESFRDVAKASGSATSTVIACLRPEGRMPKDSTVDKVAGALGIPASKLRELRGEPVMEPFTLPSKADQLDTVERRAVLNVVDALLRARESSNDVEAAQESDASGEALEAEKTQWFNVLRLDTSRPDVIIQGPSIEAHNLTDARAQLDRSLDVAGVKVDPTSDRWVKVTLSGDVVTLTTIVIDDPVHEDLAITRLHQLAAELSPDNTESGALAASDAVTPTSVSELEVNGVNDDRKKA